jgi:hypothetical protein
MKLIPLTKGQFAQVDDKNYNWLTQWKWCALKSPTSKTYYAVRGTSIGGKQVMILMHRLIMNTPIGMDCDHIDHNGLNCLEENMRNCSHRKNSMNKSPHRGGSSKYLGVCKRIRQNKNGINISFSVQVETGGKYIHVGIFKDEIVAARSYDQKAKELFGDYANLNF